jgi:predicted ATP-grasp superfamily ATP-dependent carboligase
MNTLVVASLSARLMAESARDAGFHVIALDVFGDRDTRRAARAWYAIGPSQALQLDPPRVLDALRAARREHGPVLGWVAGSGFEAWPDLLAQGAAELPLIGTAPSAQQAVRHPATFFASLAALDLPHPATQWQPPGDPASWLHKDSGSSGGWQVRPATARPLRPTPGGYYQRRAPGRPMSALFIANGRDVCVLGHQQQIAGPLRGRPFVWQGVIGPVQPPAPVQASVQLALAALVPRHGLQGLGSLDYLLDGEAHQLLEINPRPPASMALYPGTGATSPMHAHLQACLQGRLPEAPVRVAERPLRGIRTVYANRPGRLDDAALDALQATGWCHDLASGAQAFRVGDPVCTVSAGDATGPAGIEQQLALRAGQVQARLAAMETA